MSLYSAFETVVIIVLLALSVRYVWRTVLRPMLNRPSEKKCDTGCTGCEASPKNPLPKRNGSL